jgi:PAS domain S-box-containing protein
MSEQPGRIRLEAMRQAIRFFESTLHASSDGIVVTDPSQNIVMANDAFSSLFGRTWQDMIETSLWVWLEQLDGDAQRRWTGIESRTLQAEVVREIEFTKTKSGRKICLSVNASRLKRMSDEDRGGIISIWRDITKRRKMEEVLQTQNDLMNTILNTTPSPFVLKDEKSVYLAANKAFCEFLGREEKEIVGKTDHDLFPPEEAEKYVTDDRAVMSGGQREQEDWEVVGATGSQWLRVVKTPVIDKEGECSGVLCSLTDISSNKEAEKALHESRERFRNLAETTSDWVWEVDVNGTYTYANPKIRDLLGYDPEEVLGKTPFDLMPPEEAERIGAEFKAILETQRAFSALENTNLHKDGHLVVLETSGVPFLDAKGDLAGYHGIDRDITDRKKIEQMKDEFISTASHELRTPLASIRGSLDLIASGVTGELSASARELLEIAVRNCDRLMLLADDILDVERVESGRMKFELKPMEIVPLVEQAISFNRAYAQEHHVEYALEKTISGGKVNVDTDRLMQVMANLLSNAAKFSPDNEEVIVSVNRAGDAIRVSVRDSGPGIPEDFRPRIFRRFAQADLSDARKKGGTGLGLSLSKGLIEQMGGEIGFESRAGEGATFFFDFPEWIEENDATER